MKPILFNTEMVRAVLDDRKTVTRRVVKLKYSNTHLEMSANKYGTRLIEKQNEEPGVTIIKNPDGTTTHTLLACIEKEPPYRPGDILYVREKWRIVDYLDGLSLKFEYEADGKISDFIDFTNDRLKKFLKYISRKGWCPGIFMPKEAARLFLRVTDVRIERLQDITDAEAQKEGAVDREALRRIWNNCYSKPRPVKDKHGVIDHYESYPWEDVMETRTFRGKPWYIIGNPWVWVVEFERISREEANERWNDG